MHPAVLQWNPALLLLLPGLAACSRWPRLGCFVMRKMSSLGSLSWSLADNWSVVSFFTEFSSSTMPLFTTTEGGRRSSRGEKTQVGTKRTKRTKRAQTGNQQCHYLHLNRQPVYYPYLVGCSKRFYPWLVIHHWILSICPRLYTQVF